MSNLLEYIEPRRFIAAEHKFCKDSSTEMLQPEDTDFRGNGSGFRSYDTLAALCAKNRPAFGRAVAAWYLKATGLSYPAIGGLFEISASRAGGIVKTIRNQAYSSDWVKKQWDDATVRRIEKELFPAMSIGVQGAHRMIQTFVQMRDVEYLMDSLHTSQYALNSGSLRLGRARFKKQRDDVGAYRCVCAYCKPAAFPKFVEKAS